MALPLGLIKMSLAIQPKHQLVSGGTAAVCNMFVRAGECSRAFLLVKLVNAHDLGLHHAIHKIQSGKPDLQPLFFPFCAVGSRHCDPVGVARAHAEACPGPCIGGRIVTAR